MTYPSKIGATLRERRISQGLSQYGLAYLSGVSRTQIVHIEAGRVMPRLDTLLLILKPLNMELAFNELPRRKGHRSADR
jgi:transcriptional regulator with XRE-family HTH domain